MSDGGSLELHVPVPQNPQWRTQSSRNRCFPVQPRLTQVRDGKVRNTLRTAYSSLIAQELLLPGDTGSVVFFEGSMYIDFCFLVQLSLSASEQPIPDGVRQALATSPMLCFHPPHTGYAPATLSLRPTRSSAGRIPSFFCTVSHVVPGSQC